MNRLSDNHSDIHNSHVIVCFIINVKKQVENGLDEKLEPVESPNLGYFLSRRLNFPDCSQTITTNKF